jgi:hypothetical protein
MLSTARTDKILEFWAGSMDVVIAEKKSDTAIRNTVALIRITFSVRYFKNDIR